MAANRPDDDDALSVGRRIFEHFADNLRGAVEDILQGPPDGGAARGDLSEEQGRDHEHAMDALRAQVLAQQDELRNAHHDLSDLRARLRAAEQARDNAVRHMQDALDDRTEARERYRAETQRLIAEHEERLEVQQRQHAEKVQQWVATAEDYEQQRDELRGALGQMSVHGDLSDLIEGRRELEREVRRLKDQARQDAERYTALMRQSQEWARVAQDNDRRYRAEVQRNRSLQKRAERLEAERRIEAQGSAEPEDDLGYCGDPDCCGGGTDPMDKCTCTQITVERPEGMRLIRGRERVADPHCPAHGRPEGGTPEAPPPPADPQDNTPLPDRLYVKCLTCGGTGKLAVGATNCPRCHGEGYLETALVNPPRYYDAAVEDPPTTDPPGPKAPLPGTPLDQSPPAERPGSQTHPDRW